MYNLLTRTRSIRTFGHKIRRHRKGFTIIRVHSWRSADSMRRSARKGKYPLNFFVKSRPLTIITTNTSKSNCKILRKIKTLHGGHVTSKYLSSMVKVNNTLASYRQKYGPVHVTLYFSGIKFNKFISINKNGTLKIQIKYSARCKLFNQQIDVGSFLVNKNVSTLCEAKSVVILNLLYLRGLETGLP